VDYPKGLGCYNPLEQSHIREDWSNHFLYILSQASKSDWTAYLNRAMLQLTVEDDDQRLCCLLKHGLSVHHWNEFVFQAYHHHQHDAIFLAGLPDAKGSLPNA